MKPFGFLFSFGALEQQEKYLHNITHFNFEDVAIQKCLNSLFNIYTL